MAGRLKPIQIKEIVQKFLKNVDIGSLSNEYGFSLQTIRRNIIKEIGIKLFNEYKTKRNHNKGKNINDDNFSKDVNLNIKDKNINLKENNFNLDDQISDPKNHSDESNREYFPDEFLEIAPFKNEVRFDSQRELASKPINKINFPSIVYMIVSNSTELEPKFLKEYSDWKFLPNEDLNRKTLEVFSDIKDAKKMCSKNQKVLKVPNPNVFLIASQKLKSKGITRIIFDDLLVSF